MEASRIVEESGPDEDHQLLRKAPALKAVDVDCPHIVGKRGVFSVSRTDPQIEKFLNDVPYLIMHNDTHGLIWDKNLKPENSKYDKGVHFVSTREADKKTSHATVSFYRDGATGATFAIKTLQKGTHFHTEEIKVGLTVQHSNICSVYGIIVRNGSVHILLEHAGSPLYKERAWIAECPKRLQSFAKQSFQALAIIHGHGFVHCDIKPDNIMIHKNDHDGFTVKLIDFGTCHTKGTSLPSTAHTTLLYWSPEIWQALDSKNEVICRPAMDVYALALTLHFVHTSNHLMQRFENEDLKNLMIKTPDDILLVALPETIPSDLSAVMKSCLDGNHNIRTSAQEALKHLAAEDALKRWPTSSTREENYKDSFNRIYSSINKTARHAKTEISNACEIPAASQILFQNLQETVIGSSMGIEKRELKTAAKARKSTSISVNKCNKPSQKGKKYSRLQGKLSLQKVSQLSPETFQPPLISPDCDLEKGIEIKPDDKDYSYSALLKNLALHIKEPHQYTFNKSPDKPGIVQFALGDKNKTENTMKMPGTPNEMGDVNKWTVNQPVDRSYKFSGDKPELKNQQNYKCTSINDMKAVGSSGNTEKDIHVEIPDISINPVEVQSSTKPNIQVQKDNSKKDSEIVHDDMDFVLSAFDDSDFTGADADNIVNNWCSLLDKEEQTQSSSSPDGFELDMNTHQVRNVKQDQAATSTEEEPMDADHEGSASVSRVSIRSKLNLPAVKGNRKRMAESALNPSDIPGKAVFLPPSVQDMSTHQLPNFDQILPENC